MKYLKYILLLVLTATCLWSFGDGNTSAPAPAPAPTAEEVLEKMRKALSEKDAMTYTMSYKVKCFNCDDTTFFTANGKLLRDDKDTVNHGCIEFMWGDSMETVYDMENVYDIQHKKKKLTIYNPVVYKSNPLNADPYGAAIFDEFLFANVKPEKKHKLTLLDTVVINKKSCWVVQTDYPESGRITDIKRIAYIEKQSSQLVKMVSMSTYNGSLQYESYMLSNVNFPALKKEDFVPAKALARCKVLYFQPLALAVGKDAPGFDGIQLQDKKPFQLSASKGQVTLLGFWKPNTPGTDASLQLLSDMKQANDAKAVVVGIPAFKGTDPEKVKALITEKNLSFINLNPAKSTDSTYHVKSFPAFYVIDRSGKIAFRSVGYYNAAIKDSLQKAIDRSNK